MTTTGITPLMRARKMAFELKVAAYGLLWKLRGLKGGFKESTLFPRKKVFWIDPGRIRLSIDHPAAEGLRPEQGWSITPALEDDLIVPGDWDLNTVPFEAMDVWQAFQHVYTRGGRWQDTAFFQRILGEIRKGNFIGDCHDENELCGRFAYVDDLYRRIKEEGFRTQEELERAGHARTRRLDEISVHIGRDGDYIFADGRHRLCIARLLQLGSVPVRVCRRHRAWVNFKKELWHYARVNRGKLYAPVLHPDLADIPHHQDDDRIQILRDLFARKAGSLLDIGSHWGYFCHWFERWGYRCTALENSPANLHFMRKIRRAEHRQFTIHAGSALDYPFERHFDLVLALNIFHHFIKTEAGFLGLEKLLGRMKTKALIFEPHLPQEEQMDQSYRNFNPEEFVGWVRDKGGFDSVRKIGVAGDGRALFLMEHR